MKKFVPLGGMAIAEPHNGERKLDKT